LLNLSCIRDLHSFRSIQKEWDEFIEHNFPLCYNRSSEWLSSWWEAYAKFYDVSVYIVRTNARGNIIAGVPLFNKKESFSGFRVDMLEVLSRGIGNEDLPIIEEHEECLDLIFNDLNQKGKWDVLRLSRLRDYSDIDVLTNYASHKRMRYDLKASLNFRIQTIGPYEVFLKSRSGRYKNNVRTARNNMKKVGVIAFERHHIDEGNKHIFEVAKKIAELSWQYQEGCSHFTIKEQKSFIDCLLETEMVPVIQGEMFFILLDGKPLAYLFGIKRKEIFYAIETGFDSFYSKLSPGRLMYAYIIETMFNDPEIKVFDFNGAGKYKEEIADINEPEKLLILYNRNFKAKVICKVRKSKFYPLITNLLKN
jgi:CelD/BcsL family acetyltransferase involved in cellulose biosynthesis